MLSDLVLALGLLLTTASQLRIGETPFGAGELCLVVWLLTAVVGILSRRDLRPGLAFGRLLTFWALFAVALIVGTIRGLAGGEEYDPVWFIHDAMAYPLLAAVSCASVIEPGANTRLHRVAWLGAIMGAVCLLLLIAGAEDVVPLPFDLWFYERFKGWSQNPNQLALLCSVFSLVCLHLADISNEFAERTMATLCMVVFVCAGHMTQSDTFTYGLVAGGLVYACLKLRARFAMKGPKGAFSTFALVAIPVVLASAVPAAWSMAPSAEDLKALLFKNGGKEAEHETELRLSLWQQAIRRGLETQLLGLGPGPHLTIPPEIVQDHLSADSAGPVARPVQGSAANYEAHNTVLDLFTQGGLIGAGGFLWLTITAWLRTYRLRMPGLLALLTGIGVSCMTGDVIRMPVVWFALGLCLVVERQPAGGTYLAEAGRRI